MKKRIASLLLAAVILSGMFLPTGINADSAVSYPELMITEIGVDQYSDPSNAKNVNAKYAGAYAQKDPFEFIEIVNNSDKSVNVYDYMLAYQGTGSDDADYFESSVQEYTPFHPGKDWTDSHYSYTAKYWTGDEKMPENPSYENGVIAPGEVFVVWMFSDASHSLNCTEAQFRSFWSIPDGVKIFLLDADSADEEMCFSLKNSKTGSYMIMRESARFPKRRSSDKTFYPESDNKHHNYFKVSYSDLEEIINWAVVDYKTEPLKSFASANGGENSQTNFTLSFVPEQSDSKYENGFTESSVKSTARVHLEKINTYAESTVGRLNDAQKAAFEKATSTVRGGVPNRDIYTDPENNTTRPDILITRISPDQHSSASGNTNKLYTSGGADPYEFIELYNNSGKTINVYDYMVGYQGSGASSVSTYFERLIQEYTAIFPGEDWTDSPYTYHDSYWTSGTRPVNPSYEEGAIEAGKTFILWFYSPDSHKVKAQFEDFRSFWKIGQDVKVFLVDADSNRDKNFNVKNSSTGTYVILKPSTRYPQRRSDDETLNTEDAKRFWSLDLTYDDMPEVVSWAVVDFGCYEPLYTFSSKNNNSSFTTNYTLRFAPGDRDNPEFINGYLTTSLFSAKRCHLSSVAKTYAESNVGVLDDAQKAAIEKAFK